MTGPRGEGPRGSSFSRSRPSEESTDRAEPLIGLSPLRNSWAIRAESAPITELDVEQAQALGRGRPVAQQGGVADEVEGELGESLAGPRVLGGGHFQPDAEQSF